MRGGKAGASYLGGGDDRMVALMFLCDLDRDGVVRFSAAADESPWTVCIDRDADYDAMQI